jgi:hypothetical protein
VILFAHGDEPVENDDTDESDVTDGTRSHPKGSICCALAWELLA